MGGSFFLKLKYKKFYRKTSLKQRGIGDLFLSEIQKKNPKYFLEIGIFHGVTARNVCDLMCKNHGNQFRYIGVDLFEEGEKYRNEIVPKLKFKNPLKNIYFKFIKKQNPYSIEAVRDLLNKHKDNVEIIKGNTNKILKTLTLKDIDYIFIDGGHDYETVKNDLFYCKKFLKQNGTILCDDYDLSYAPGVRKAIEEFVMENNCKFEILFNRFAKIEF